jgi:hypothetical protein
LGISHRNNFYVQFTIDGARHTEARTGSGYAESAGKACASAKSGQPATRRQACATAAEVSRLACGLGESPNPLSNPGREGAVQLSMKQSSSANRTQVSPTNDGDGATTVLRASDGLGRLVEAWAAKQADKPDFPEAVVRLLRLGLTKQFIARVQRTSKSMKASTLAEIEIDRQADQSASADEQSDRRKQLIEGPAEFRQSRVDQRRSVKDLT